MDWPNAQLAEHGNRVAAAKAARLLAKAEKDGHNDAQVHMQLGLIQQESGDQVDARKEYAEALREDPTRQLRLGELGRFWMLSLEA